MAAESEYEFAIRLARRVLDNASLDPDGDMSVLARQFLRSQVPGVIQLRAAGLHATAAAVCQSDIGGIDAIREAIERDRGR